MSGIAGIYSFSGSPVVQRTLARMLDVLAHRGPDGRQGWCENRVGLGHCMLHTTPESHYEQQPLVSRDGQLVLTADARIDNRETLIRQLHRHGRPHASITDAELILAAYERWEEACPEKLLGDFAFAIWDERRQRLFCARDHLGVRPFYYAHVAGRLFAFGSEIKAVLGTEGVSERLDQERIALHLLNRIENETSTSYADVKRLPPAHWMSIEADGRCKSQRYWSLDPDHDVRFASDEEYVEGFLDVFREAVQCRLRSTGPAGVMLSGGLDSSAVACTAGELLRASGAGPLHTFSAVFTDLPPAEAARADERRYIDAIAAHEGIVSHKVPMDGASPLEDIERILWHADQPCYVRNIYLDVLLSQTARQQGVRVLLDGLEGDDAVSHGYSYLSELAFQRRWDDFATEAKALAAHTEMTSDMLFEWKGAPFFRSEARRISWRTAIHSAGEIHRHLGVPRSRLFWEHGLKPHVPSVLGPAALRMRQLIGIHRARRHLLTPELAKHLPAPSPSAKSAGTTYSAKLSHGRVFDHPSISLFMEEGNHFAAAGGVEARHPFYDVRLLTYCVALPAEQKLRNGWTRFILRQAMRGIMPEVIRTRTDKGDISPNFKRNLLHMERARIAHLLDDPDSRLEPYINLDTARVAFEAGHVEALWTVLQFGFWLGLRAGSTTLESPGVKDTSSFAEACRDNFNPVTS